MRKTFLILLFTALTLTLTAQTNPLMREPSVNNSGTKVAFSLQGDIWTVPFSGGEAKRLTVHEAYESNPIWSPDGKHIAFESTRFGNSDIFVTDPSGVTPTRLTFHSAGDNLTGWAGNNTLLFSTSRVYNKVHWDAEIHKVNTSGGTPERILDAYGNYAVESPDGKFIAFVKGACRVAREAYRGSANKDIWLYVKSTGKYVQLTDFDGNDYLPRWAGNSIYYISASAGKYNIFKMTINDNGNANGAPAQVTNFKEFGVRHFGLNADGSKIAAEVGGDIYTISDGGSPKVLAVEVPSDYKFDPIERKTVSSGATDFSVSPDGKYIALVSDGEVFVTENDKDESRAVNISNHPYRDQYVQWISDSTLIFVSDRDGQFDIYMAKSADEDETDLFKTLKREIVRITDTDEDESWPVVSPDLKKVAYERGLGGLIVADIGEDGSLSNEVVLLDGWGEPGNVSWSPDSKWLAYSHDDLYYNSEIFIHPADNSSERVNVSMHPKGDASPTWSPDGSKLAFISERNNRDNDVWFVWLKKSDWLQAKEDLEEDDDEDSKSKKDDKDSTKSKNIEIDFDGIHERLTQVTTFAGNESSPVFDKEGENIYFVMNSTTGTSDRNIFKITWDRKDLTQITNGKTSPSSLISDKDAKNIYFLKSGGSIQKLPTSKDKAETIPYKGKMVLNHPEIRNQVFEEAWRALDMYFYDPKFHGWDFNELKDKYKPLADRATTYEDFRYIYNIMLGQLNASHMGLYGSGPEDTQKDRTGRIGIEVKPASGGVEITHVVPGTPAQREESTLNTGDIIVAVDGQKIKETTNFYELMGNTSGEKILMEVKRKGGDTEEVVIRPKSSISTQLYEEWISSRKQLTEKYSNGRLGYIHIRGMDINSFERFERELMASGYGKEGIVIDVRFNGGGWTTDYLMTVLNVRQHAYTIPRGAVEDLDKENQKYSQYYPYGERLPYAAWVQPSIAMCNSMSYSNAEIFSHAYKTLGIGKLVGETTFGAVISTWGRDLQGGSFVRLPRRAWYVKATGKSMENIGAQPDYEVQNAPDQDFFGDDAQLQKAVDVLLKQIDGTQN